MRAGSKRSASSSATRRAPVLVVVGDVPLAETFAPLVDEPATPYAFAVQARRAGDGPGIALALAARAGAERERPGWPPALEFLRWWLSTEPRLEQTSRSGAQRWTRP